MNKFLLFVFASFVMLAANAGSQEGTDASYPGSLDSALQVSGLNRSDLRLPCFDESFNRGLAGSLYNDPLALVGIGDRIANGIRSVATGNFEEYFSDLFRTLDFRPWHFYDFSEILPSRYINEKFKTDFYSNIDLISANVLRQYLSPVILAMDALDKDELFRSPGILAYLSRECDSIIFFPDQPENIYKMTADIERWEDLLRQFVPKADVYKRSEINNIAVSLYSALLKVNELTRRNIKLYRDSIKTTVFQTPFGNIAIGGAGDDNYNGDFILIIDIGGNDIYNFPSDGVESGMKSSVRCIIDFDGNDAYIGGNFAFGGAAFGISLVLDLAGNDSYSAENYSLGSGLFGFGMLRDFSGSDIYSANKFSEGSAQFGIGILLDESGNDVYSAKPFSQGFSYSTGFGCLADFSGNDSYISSTPYKGDYRGEHYFSFSQGAGLGIMGFPGIALGLLADGSGNDNYIGDIAAQGFGQYSGIGILDDSNGDDRYQAYKTSQGASQLGGFGFLRDRSGSDIYLSGMASQGFAAKNAFALLIDDNGNDKYLTSYRKQPHNCDYSRSLLFDHNGNGKFGWLENSDESPALFLSVPPLVSEDGAYAFAMNGNSSRPASEEEYAPVFPFNPELISGIPVASGKNSDSLAVALPSGIDSLFVLASLDYPPFSAVQKAASGMIIDNMKSYWPGISKNLSCPGFRSVNTMNALLAGMLEKDKESLLTLLPDSLSSNDVNTISLLLNFTWSKNIPEIAEKSVKLLASPDWRIRLLSAKVAARGADGEVLKGLEHLLSDKEPFVRMYASYAVGQVFPSNALELLSPVFADSSIFVREAAFKGLVTNNTLSADAIISLLNDQDVKLTVYSYLARLLPFCEIGRKEIKNIRKSILSLPYEARKAVYEVLVASQSSFWTNEVKFYFSKETEPELESILDK